LKQRSIDFSKFSSIKIGPLVDVTIIEYKDELPKDHMIIGYANNLLISPSPPKLMMLGDDFDYIKIEKDSLVIGAATSTGKLLSFCRKFDIGGFEYIAKLPGTIGGMIAMNAGVKSYETFDLLLEIKTDRGFFVKEDIEYGYRYAKLPGTVLEARFKLKNGYNKNLTKKLIQLRSNQPKMPSAGSIFKNPPGDFAGRLIEAVGLKGARLGNVAWSDIHANFLVNLGDGRYEDAMALIELAQKSVYEKFGKRLELEVKIVTI